ncbi:Glycine-rich RNA-binding protein 4-mitochondrial [Striga hermonthica]|uniref:Glycine-rich RNA-binding protein 4-mitochondrial n=1 Tax=Striga hermonthica TaxID=68872 RepID=A0A9N7MSG2_STRHE|nr:Glycine-rich RNA-binding protein 4-mitochondrial [Striga hermonthica]
MRGLQGDMLVHEQDEAEDIDMENGRASETSAISMFMGSISELPPPSIAASNLILTCLCLTWRHSCTQLFVGGLSCNTNEKVLKDTFQEFGDLIEVKVICDRVSGESRGYGFVKYSSAEAANKAMKERDGHLLDGRNIRIRYAHKGS